MPFTRRVRSGHKWCSRAVAGRSTRLGHRSRFSGEGGSRFAGSRRSVRFLLALGTFNAFDSPWISEPAARPLHTGLSPQFVDLLLEIQELMLHCQHPGLVLIPGSE